MAILNIAVMGNPVLSRPASPIIDPDDPSIAALIGDMLDTVAAAGGVGLAAPQVARGLQLVVFEVPAGRTADGAGLPMTVLINPSIEPLDETVEEAYEACLSVPGLTARVPRWRHIGYRGLGIDGKLIEREATGFHARVVQHECDHLWGRLYLSRLEDLSTLAFTDELRRQVSEAAASRETGPLAVQEEEG
jgi:peptide deformylase